MAFPFLAAGLTALPSLAQGIFGAIQAGRGNRLFKQQMANRPQYEIPEEYQKVLSMYQTAMSGNAPGYSQTLSNIGQAGARARGGLERGAISSNAYGAGVSDLYQKELDAIQNLGIQQEQWKAQQMANVAQAQGALAGQKSTQWELNKYIPWQTETQRAGEMRKAGIENMFGAAQGLASGMSDLVGTKLYTDALAKMYGSQSGLGNTAGAVKSTPLSIPSSTPDLMKTSMDKLYNIPTYYTDPLLSYKYNKG